MRRLRGLPAVGRALDDPEALASFAGWFGRSDECAVAEPGDNRAELSG
ncbi:hypothetical protein WOC76_18340 [Methylocystis sp. IM3]|jgi:hypothetical protein